jgi:hypothetical protein
MPQQLYPRYLLEAEWAPQAVSTFCRTEKSPASARNRTPRPSTGILRNMFKKDAKNVCTRTAVISADSSTPIPSTPSAVSTPENKRPDHPELPDEGDIKMKYSSD